MNKILITFIFILGAVYALWQVDLFTQSSSVVTSPPQPVETGDKQNSGQHDAYTGAEDDMSVTSSELWIPDDVKDIANVIHQPVIPVKKAHIQLSPEEIKLLTTKREQASIDIQQAMLEYDQYLDDPVKRAQIKDSIQGNREIYKQAMIKLAKESLNQ